MNRYSFLIGIMIIPKLLFSQILNGSSESTIREIYNRMGVEITTDYTYGGIKYISVQPLENLRVSFYFNENQICINTMMFPNSDEMLNVIIAGFNKDCIIIDNYTWKKYDKHGVTLINLRYRKEIEGFVFYCELLEE
jgi:hypothetical protein